MSRHWGRSTPVTRANDGWTVQFKNTETNVEAVFTFPGKDLGHNKEKDGYYTTVDQTRADHLADEVEKTIEAITENW